MVVFGVRVGAPFAGVGFAVFLYWGVGDRLGDGRAGGLFDPGVGDPFADPAAAAVAIVGEHAGAGSHPTFSSPFETV